MCDITRPRRWRSCYRRHDHQCSTCKERGPANIPSLKNSVLPQLTFSYRLSLPFSLIIMFFFFFFRGLQSAQAAARQRPFSSGGAPPPRKLDLARQRRQRVARTHSAAIPTHIAPVPFSLLIFFFFFFLEERLQGAQGAARQRPFSSGGAPPPRKLDRARQRRPRVARTHTAARPK
jgi:hypothetical protein